MQYVHVIFSIKKLTQLNKKHCFAHEKMLNTTHYQRNANQTTMRYHFMPVRMAAIQSLQATNDGEGVEKREPSYTVHGNAN